MSAEKFGWAALQYAAEGGSPGVVTLLLAQEGAAVDVCNPANMFTALHIASIEGHLEVVKPLHSHGADIHQTCKGSKAQHGCSALHFAVNRGHPGVATFLVEQQGADTHFLG
ncbi:MAG: hypothetical protein WDW38_000186 [Sanguina aurantia]